MIEIAWHADGSGSESAIDSPEIDRPPRRAGRLAGKVTHLGRFASRYEARYGEHPSVSPRAE
ncbi:hypothetical protein [Mycolicibacterium goodii]|uniref:Uncharacterized protein n=1 Tax=Mycolicibacterium goodii TaxID=134601 RepID=A0A0K0X2D8_MYCGD|nr:hypothetical protein AFA91_06655 [Mycolicibacterium goodii]